MSFWGFLFRKNKVRTEGGSTVNETKPGKRTIVTLEGIKLSNEQADCYNRIENTNDNYFITGKAGSGKSVVLRHFIATTKKKVAVTAPTGIAAINVSGQTLHSFFGLSTTVQLTQDPKMVKLSAKQTRMLKELDTLVIDEISMVRVDIMDMIDAKLRLAKSNPNTPFGGCQIIVFGDLYQLPPVVDSDDISKDSVYRYLIDRYGTVFFFGAPAVRQNPFTIIELEQVHRQKDNTFITTLNRIRNGENSTDLLNRINARCVPDPVGVPFLTITPHRKTADEINRSRLAALSGPEYTYIGQVGGKFTQTELPTDQILKLKVGAQIMMLRNDNNKRWVNGTLGIITALDDDMIKVSVPSGTYSIDKETWRKYAYEYDPEAHELTQKTVGVFTQFPIRLSYAITIHKSQGQTYDNVKIDYSGGREFEAGQTYVALSRCKSLEGLYLKNPLQADDIKISQEVVNFMSKRFNPVVKPLYQLTAPTKVADFEIG